MLPGSEEDFIIVRPLGGINEEVTGIRLALESVEPAHFSLPNPQLDGNFLSARLLRDAASHRGRYRVEPKLPVDVLGVYVYLPE